MYKVVRPKTLYRYFERTLEKHKITKECSPQIEIEYPYIGVVWRCKCSKVPIKPGYSLDSHDFHGFATLFEAKLEAIESAKKEIYEYNKFIEKHIKGGNKA